MRNQINNQSSLNRIPQNLRSSENQTAVYIPFTRLVGRPSGHSAKYQSWPALAALILSLIGATIPHIASATVRYVNASGANPTPPYTNWSTAATVIQAAVDVSNVGDEVLVTNGVYALGGRIGSGLLTNRVVVDKPIALRSVNGSAVTVIQGYQVPGDVNGDAAVRCASLAEGASLTGFTLTEGATLTTGDWDVDQVGGGVWCAGAGARLTNCVVLGNSAWDSGGGVFGGTLNNCVVQDNSSFNMGGGAYASTLNGCLVVSNDSLYGGGTCEADLTYSIIVSNLATAEGGGSYDGTLTYCSLSNNVAAGDPYGTYGGGASSAVLQNCLLTANVADYDGGASGCDLYSCLVVGNSATVDGGGVGYCEAQNCTIIGNQAAHNAGGSDSSGLINCIVYYNSAPGAANHSGSACSSCEPIISTCTTPLPSGTGNITNEPALADAQHLSAASPCRGAGDPLYATGTDLDGDPWARPPSMGCDEFVPGGASGPLTVAIQADYTAVATGFTVHFTAQIGGHASASRWDFGDSTIVSNRPYATHRWSAAGSYPVVLTAFNDSNPGGIRATTVVSVVTAPVHYVVPDNPTPSYPYGSWATAAPNIQEAIDAATVPGAVVLVTNGTYQTGGRAVYGTLLNRVAATQPVLLRSVNGPASTVIVGAQPNGDSAVRCVHLGAGAALEGFTLTNGATRLAGDETLEQAGGGIWCEQTSGVISNCVLAGCTGGHGGAAYGGTFVGCTLQRNSSVNGGGGVEAATLQNCLLSQNTSTGYGGGAKACTLNSCTLQGNSTSGWGGGASDSVLNDCLVTGNAAPASTSSGGGAHDCFLEHCLVTSNTASTAAGVTFCSAANCLFIGNTASQRGGGAGFGSLRSCTIVGNTALSEGGGVYDSAMENCIVYYNQAPTSPDYGSYLSGGEPVNYCCTGTLVPGVGNFTNAPLFVNPAGGNYRLQSGSPCINAGRNSTAGAGPDFDYSPRIAGGTVDVGAYEFASPLSRISYQWLQRYGLALDGSADNADPDHDGATNWAEWVADTNPTNALSVLRLLSATRGAGGVTITWPATTTRTYFVERASSPAGASAFSLLQDNLPGQAGVMSFTDPVLLTQPRLFYRVGVRQ